MPSGVRWSMSASGQKADICSAKRHVRFTPESRHRPVAQQVVALPDVITSHPHSGRCCAGKVFTFTPSVQFADVHGGRSNLRQPDFTA